MSDVKAISQLENLKVRAVAVAASEFVEVAAPFFERYKALIPTSLAGYFSRLASAVAEWRKAAQ